MPPLKICEPGHAVSLIRLAHDFVAEIEASAQAVDNLAMLQEITAWLSQPQRYRVHILGPVDGRVVGVQVLALAQWFFNHQPFVRDAWTYVLPDYRSLPAFRQFVTAAEGWIAELKGDSSTKVQLIFGTSNGIDIERKAKLYERAGFTQLGNIFMREV